MPLQRFTQQTVRPFPCGYGRPLEVNGKNSGETSQPGPKPWRVVSGAVDVAARWPLLFHRSRIHYGPRFLRVSSSKTHTGSRGRTIWVLSEDFTCRVGLLSWGSSVLPLHRHKRCASTSDGRNHHQREDATLLTRSALAVFHDFGGLLRAAPCEFVAPRCRS